MLPGQDKICTHRLDTVVAQTACCVTNSAYSMTRDWQMVNYKAMRQQSMHQRWQTVTGCPCFQFDSNSIPNKSPACQTLYLVVSVMQLFKATCWSPKTKTQNNTWTILSMLVWHQLYSTYFLRELLSSETLRWPKTWWHNMNTLQWCNQRGWDLDESWWQILMLYSRLSLKILLKKAELRI